ncbi:C4-dicarboxylate ABC transporter permease [Marinobacterium nitratireducens]|uniref:TRAP transporter large permease protein n=1 Tax=Marinobacterium nitratireducens TaxID=518897 RepID=A0A917ZCD0_9GAMM|nr:TRAP transporter large permease [Marinobacterium nitratireducens]GGO79882.1 C4-dicarboxylate ABC transporter permease [Marinobacterium nitratireducens]
MTIALVGFALLLLLAFTGIPLGVVSIVVGVLGFAYYRGWDAAMTMASQQFLETAGNQSLVVIPLFILMGIFIWRANISDDIYAAGYSWFGRRKGGVAMSTVAASGLFSAVCGSSLATAATMSKVAMPALRKYRYSDSISSGTIAAGGTLGIMIPPSVPMVIYAIVAQEDVGLLFISGIVPGILLILSFILAIYIVATVYPTLAPRGEKTGWVEKFKSLNKVSPIIGIFATILGGIYTGVFTPTEAATIGVILSLLYSVISGRIRSKRVIFDCLSEATIASASIFMIIIGSMIFASFINMTGLPYDILDFVESLELGPTAFVIAVCLVFTVLGMFFETIGILVLALPVFLPTLYAMDINLIWFGILTIIVIELGLITPPIGMNVFVVKSSIPDININKIFAGVIPFLIADLMVLVAVFYFPSIATLFTS